ncbi:hypothetical protein Misp01_76090 [Microtetraspora sp. NBRC 13810]|uniref:DUF6049 family protein n=1 Tax=Microtetraspora sp. NBRC 13810 TaxID=3030990 RepID=UPI0024A50291|nr:DUF6049 family protein [Microtetraspora sp. NBRC 13810]GLW12481.1 hypothetical protein Misp01_76090 [Microtetraspora sp. NBRC 13810]
MIREVALLTALTATLLAPSAVSAGTTAAAKSTLSRESPTLTIDSITPDVPRERSTEIKISATFANSTGGPLGSMTMRLRKSTTPFADRTAMAAYQAGQGPADLASLSASVTIPSLTAGAKFSHEFVVSPAQLEQFDFGVYPLAVEVVDSFGRTLALQRTFMPYAPRDTDFTRSKFSVLLPLFDAQPRRSDDRTFLDDDLRTALTGDGRLASLATLVKDTSADKAVSWLVDPSLLDDVTAMTGPYVVGTGGDQRKRPAEPAAAPWLDGLRASLAGASVFAAPYADPDVTALAHQGLDGATGTAVRTSAAVAKELLGRDVPTDVNWPVSGLVDYDGLDALADAGVRTVVLDGRNLPPAQAAAQTPTQTPVQSTAQTPDAATTVTSVYGDMTALVADPVLSDVLGDDVSAPGAAVLAKQRFIAETAMIAAESPATAKNLVAAPYRRWHPDPAFVSGLLKTAESLPWLAPTPLSSIKRPAAPTPRADLTYTDQNRKAELGKSYLTRVKRAFAQADLTAAVTQQEESPIFTRALLRLASAGWRGKTGTARTAVEQVDKSIAGRIDEVSITGAEQPRTLAGDDGVVPISVHNSLGEAVSIRLDVKSTNSKLLEIQKYDQAVVIGARQNQTVQVPLTAHVNGDTTVTVQLRTDQDRRYGPPVKLTVRTTGYTGIALVIVGGALSVMLAAVVLRVLRRRTQRSSRKARPAKGAAPAGPSPQNAPAARPVPGGAPASPAGAGPAPGFGQETTMPTRRRPVPPDERVWPETPAPRVGDRPRPDGGATARQNGARAGSRPEGGAGTRPENGAGPREGAEPRGGDAREDEAEAEAEVEVEARPEGRAGRQPYGRAGGDRADTGERPR